MSRIFCFLLLLLSVFLKVDAASSCGTSGFSTGFVINGTQSRQGEWPWLVALFNSQTDEFFCGGTLLSENMVLTAAHCIKNKRQTTAKTANQIVVKAGRYDISKTFEPDSDTVQVTDIKIHEKWNPNSNRYDSDIAILFTETKIRISTVIFPICLPTQDELRVFNVKNGIVAGWGKSESAAKHESILRHTTIDIIENEQCYNDDQRIAAISSRNTFCGGSNFTSGPCSGDSGGPLIVKVNSRWFIRGIVSAGLLTDNKCDVNARIVYTNVLKFIKWIHQVADSFELNIQEPTQSTSGNEIFCFFESWAEGRAGNGAFRVQDFPHDLCTKAVFLHAELDGDGIRAINPLAQLEENGGRNLYRRFTEMKLLNPKLKTLLAVGSWNEGSRPYSNLAADPNRRKKFARITADFLMKYGFDGMHLHWEYPAHNGGAAEDRVNFVSLLKDVKEVFNKHQLYLSVMVRTGRDDVNRGYDMENIAKYADAICLFTMDFGAYWFFEIDWSAALRGEGDDNVEARVNFMLNQGAPSEKMLMSLPFYGRSFTTNKTSANIGDKSDDGFPGPFAGENGFTGYAEICHLKKTKATSWKEQWDTRANQMMGRFEENGRKYVITYDTPRSVANKIKFAKEKNLGGIWVWFVSTDDFQEECPDDVTTFADYPYAIRPPRKERKFPLLRTVNEAMNILSN